jgi:hypothetical protein
MGKRFIYYCAQQHRCFGEKHTRKKGRTAKKKGRTAGIGIIKHIEGTTVGINN